MSATRTKVTSLLLLAVCVAVGSVEIGFFIRAHPQLSYVDELQHYDYLSKVSSGHFVRRGETLSQGSMRLMACRGLDIDRQEYERFYGQPYDVPPCGADRFDPARFPELGVNHTSVHPPLYYAATGMLARAIRAAPGVRGLLTAARIANLFWFVLTLLLLWLLLGELDVSPMRRTFPVLLFATAPPIVQTFGAIGPDAASFAAGAGVVLAALRWDRGAGGLPTLAAASFAAVALKETNAIVIGLVLIYLALRARREERGGFARFAAAAGAVTVAVGLVAGGWLFVESRNSDLPASKIPLMERFQQDSLSSDDALSQLDAAVTPVHDVLPPRFLRTEATGVHQQMLDWFLLGCAAAAAMLASPAGPAASLGGATVAMMLATGPVIVVVNYLLLGIYLQIPQRYGFTLVPALVALAGVVADRRWVHVATASLAILGFVAVVQAAIRVL